MDWLDPCRRPVVYVDGESIAFTDSSQSDCFLVYLNQELIRDECQQPCDHEHHLLIDYNTHRSEKTIFALFLCRCKRFLRRQRHPYRPALYGYYCW